MSIKVYSGSRKAISRIKNLDKLTKSGVEHGAYTSAVMLRKATSEEILRKPKGGRVYIRRDRAGRRRRHVASAPGETHANLTGALRRSLGFKVNPNSLEFGYGVQSADAPQYAEWIEFGTAKVKARPSLKNGIKSQRRNMQNNFDREIGKRLEGRGGLF